MQKKLAPDARDAIPSGTLDLLILRCITDAPQHGYAIARRIKERSASTLLVEEGSLYPALHRLVRLRHVTAMSGTSENNRRARYYQITAAGRRRLKSDTTIWRRVSSAVTAVLEGRDLPPQAEGTV